MLAQSKSGYAFGSFTEIAETVMHTQTHGYVMLALHEAEEIKIQDGIDIEHGYVVGLYRGDEDSYNAEQFAYAPTDTTINDEFYGDYEQAKQRYLTLLGTLIYDHGI